jgi:hypothetical protein
MAYSVTDWLHHSRLTVIAVDPATRRVRVKGAADACTELTCRDEVTVATDDGDGGIGMLCAGDIVRIESRDGAPERIVVVRRAWDEISSPEF